MPENIPAIRLQLGQLRFQDLGSLAAFKIFAVLPTNPLLAFEHQVRELRGDLLLQKFQQGDRAAAGRPQYSSPVWRCSRPDCSRSARLAFPDGGFGRPFGRTDGISKSRRNGRGCERSAWRQEPKIRGLTDEFKKVHFRHFNKFRAQINIVVDVVYPDGEMFAQGKFGHIRFKIDVGAGLLIVSDADSP